MIIHKNVLNSFLVNNCRLGRVDINPPSLIFNNNNMALQVWLPLNKSGADKNQGLASINIINNASYEVSGKLGGCYKNGTINSGWGKDYNACLGLSASCWINIPTVEGNAIILGSVHNYPANTRFYVGCYNGYFSGGFGNTAWGDAASNRKIESGTWYHLCMTTFGTNWKLYINGQCVQEKTSSENPVILYGNIYIGEKQALYSDFRIYDHCLSPKEVKEISKGLVLHYPLNSLVNPNLVKNSYFCTNMNNGTVEVVPNVGYVDNTAYYGSPAYHVFREGQTTIAYSEFQFIFRANKCVPGKQYCISFWVKKCHSGGNWGNIILDGLRWFKTDDNTMYTTSITWNNRPSESLLNVWQYASFYFTFPVECTAYAYYYNTVGKDIDYYISKIKVEEGTVSTPWCDYGITNNIVYDCSGYQNNGTISGSLSCSANSSRYKISTVFDGISSKIINDSFPASIVNGTNSFTICGWAYCIKGNSYNPLFHIGSSYRTTTGICLHGNGDRIEGLDINGTTINNTYGSGYSNEKWVHQCIVYDGTTIKRYLNGNSTPVQSIACPGFKSDNNKLCVGGFWGVPFKGYLSDFRVYATALSADDIKELYNVSCIINS